MYDTTFSLTHFNQQENSLSVLTVSNFLHCRYISLEGLFLREVHFNKKFYSKYLPRGPLCPSTVLKFSRTLTIVPKDTHTLNYNFLFKAHKVFLHLGSGLKIERSEYFTFLNPHTHHHDGSLSEHFLFFFSHILSTLHNNRFKAILQSVVVTHACSPSC